MAGDATSAAGGGPSLRTRSDLITKRYCKLGMEDFEENFVAALPKTLPDPIGGPKAGVEKAKGCISSIVMYCDAARHHGVLQEAAL